MMMMIKHKNSYSTVFRLLLFRHSYFRLYIPADKDRRQEPGGVGGHSEEKIKSESSMA